MSLLRAGALVSALALAGRALGYARTVAAAAPLGAGGVQGAFVPAFAPRLAEDGPEAARRLVAAAMASGALALRELASAWRRR